jgi:hypothetical protein
LQLNVYNFEEVWLWRKFLTLIKDNTIHYKKKYGFSHTTSCDSWQVWGKPCGLTHYNYNMWCLLWYILHSIDNLTLDNGTNCSLFTLVLTNIWFWIIIVSLSFKYVWSNICVYLNHLKLGFGIICLGFWLHVFFFFEQFLILVAYKLFVGFL